MISVFSMRPRPFRWNCGGIRRDKSAKHEFIRSRRRFSIMRCDSGSCCLQLRWFLFSFAWCGFEIEKKLKKSNNNKTNKWIWKKRKQNKRLSLRVYRRCVCVCIQSKSPPYHTTITMCKFITIEFNQQSVIVNVSNDRDNSSASSRWQRQRRLKICERVMCFVYEMKWMG